MANEIFQKNEFAVEIVASGKTLDNSPSFNGKAYSIDTWVIRLNHIALSEWMKSAPVNVNDWEWDYESKEAAEAAAAEHEKNLAAFEAKIKDILKITHGSAAINRNVSEIFTVVNIHEI